MKWRVGLGIAMLVGACGTDAEPSSSTARTTEENAPRRRSDETPRPPRPPAAPAVPDGTLQLLTPGEEPFARVALHYVDGAHPDGAYAIRNTRSRTGLSDVVTRGEGLVREYTETIDITPGDDGAMAWLFEIDSAMSPEPTFAMVNQQLAGAIARVTVTPTGVVSGQYRFEELGPMNTNPALGQEYQAMLRQALPPLPEEPIGVHARWRVRVPVSGGPRPTHAETTFELLERDGERVLVEMTTEIVGPPPLHVNARYDFRLDEPRIELSLESRLLIEGNAMVTNVGSQTVPAPRPPRAPDEPAE